MRYTYQHNGQNYTVELEAQADGRYQATVDGRVYAVEAKPLPNGGWHLRLVPTAESRSPQGYTVYGEAQGDKRFVSLGGVSYTLNVPDQRSGRRRSAGSSGDLTAQMPGQVVNVLVKEGDTVERGQTLVILE